MRLNGIELSSKIFSLRSRSEIKPKYKLGNLPNMAVVFLSDAYELPRTNHSQRKRLLPLIDCRSKLAGRAFRAVK